MYRCDISILKNYLITMQPQMMLHTYKYNSNTYPQG